MRAAAQLDLDLTRSTFVGDALSDVQAARAAGCRPVLVRTGRGAAAAAALPPDLAGTPVADDLAGAVRLVLAAAAGG